MSDATQTQRPRVTVQQFNALVTEVREIHRKLDLVLDKLNIPLTPPAPTKGPDGVRHPVGSQPFGTRLAPEPEPDPIPGASPATARAMLRKAQEAREALSAPDGHDDAGSGGERNTGAVVVPLDSRARQQHPTARRNDIRNDERTN